MILSRENAHWELQGHDIYCAHTYWRNKTGREKDEFYDFVLVDTLNSHRVVVIRVSYDWDKKVDYVKTIAKYRMFFTRVYKDKEAGLIVDYIGMAAELKAALNQYTKRDQDKVPNLQAAYEVCLAKLEVMRDFFYAFNFLCPSDFAHSHQSFNLFFTI